MTRTTIGPTPFPTAIPKPMNSDHNFFDQDPRRRMDAQAFRIEGLKKATAMVPMLRRLSARPGFTMLDETADTFDGVIGRALSAECDYAETLADGDSNPVVEGALESLYRLVDREAEFLEAVARDELGEK